VAYRSLREIYRQFEKLFSNSRMIRSPEELEAAIRAADMDYEEITLDWLRGLDKAWVYGDVEAPFSDDRTNRKYRERLAS
jgi:hypothetical protein